MSRAVAGRGKNESRSKKKGGGRGGLWRMYVMGNGLFGGPECCERPGRAVLALESNPYRGDSGSGSTAS